MNISAATRRNIFDILKAEQVVYYGEMSEREFLSRLYDLENMPSLRKHPMGALGDFCTNRLSSIPPKWGDDWVFSDLRFQLAVGPDEMLLQFLCEMLHPLVRSDTKEIQRLFEFFNEQLGEDGWELFIQSRIHGRPVFAARRKLVPAGTASAGIKNVAKALGAEYLSRQIIRMEAAIESDAELAIGTAKELVETCCRTILTERGKSIAGAPDVPTLTKETLKELKLLPDGVPEQGRGNEVIRRVLSNLATIGHGLAEIRGLYGTGHGKDGKTHAIKPRHAKLAVGAAAALATFLFETHKETKL
jgi:hypothetical protein